MAFNEEEAELSNCTTASRSKASAMLKTPTKRKVLEAPKKSSITVKRNESSSPKPPRKTQPKIKVAKEPDRKLLVAADFGTTFSALAYAQTRKPEIQTPIEMWPDATSSGLEGVSHAKVPTEIAYDGDNVLWGFQIGESTPRHQWFKLALDPSQNYTSPLASQYADVTHALPNDDPMKLGTDFLAALRKHAEQIVRYKIPESALSDIPIEYIITVPAVWSDMAKAKTRECADAAGMGAGAALHIISEPEAAAVYALDALDPHGIKIGDTFMLCDAGGGTVDLITYRVSGLKPNLKLTEAAPGCGSLCGASFLNRGFKAYLEAMLGDEPGWDEEVLEEAMKRFELVVKRQFRGTAGEEFQIPVPGIQDNKAKHIRKNKMAVAGATIKSIFDPVVKEVLRLVKSQIEAAETRVKAIILVGGFGSNAYLRDAIRESVESSDVEVLQSPNGWTAVVRGALMKGLASTSPAFSTVKISERSARKHYGINCGVQYLDKEHGSAKKIWDACSGFFRTYRMDWFIKKGDKVKEDDPVRLNYQRTRRVARGPFTKISTMIYCSSDPKNSGAAEYVEDDSVAQLVRVEADLSRIPEQRIPMVKGADGKMYYKIDYAVQVTYRSAYTSYELVYGGKNYGQITAEYV